jgi:hypothetical protein
MLCKNTKLFDFALLRNSGNDNLCDMRRLRQTLRAQKCKTDKFGRAVHDSWYVMVQASKRDLRPTLTAPSRPLAPAHARTFARTSA